MANRNRHPAYGLVYAAMLPQLQEIAREHGYALGVHGSMHTDLDLIAAPWTEEAADAEVLVEAIRAATNSIIATPLEGPAYSVKPHGRLAWTMVGKAGNDPFIDLSVIPKWPPGFSCEELDSVGFTAEDDQYLVAVPVETVSVPLAGFAGCALAPRE